MAFNNIDTSTTQVETIWSVSQDPDSIGELIEVVGTPTPPAIIRMQAYQVDLELNYLFDDIEEGLFGEQAKTGKFYQYVLAIKDQYPKN
jgi:hypothetical protein